MPGSRERARKKIFQATFTPVRHNFYILEAYPVRIHTSNHIGWCPACLIRQNLRCQCNNSVYRSQRIWADKFFHPALDNRLDTFTGSRFLFLNSVVHSVNISQTLEYP